MAILLIIMKIIYIYKRSMLTCFMCMFCSEKHDMSAAQVPLQKNEL